MWTIEGRSLVQVYHVEEGRRRVERGDLLKGKEIRAEEARHRAVERL